MKLAHKICVLLLVTAVLLVVASFAFIWWIGAWNLVFPKHTYESTPPEIATDFGEKSRLRVLSFTKTNSFRHSEGIAGSRILFDRLAAKRDWAVFHSENSALFDAEHLARFDVVVFANASGDTLSDEQDLAFQSWLEAGGGWVGIHAAGDGSHQEWTWYQDNLIGGVFTAHIMGPQTQEARVVIEDAGHPVTQGLPPEFKHSEEWYSWDSSARTHGFDVLLTVDESSYEPFVRGMGPERDLRMKDHPIVWSRCIGRGRAIYSTMGHWGEAYETSNYARLLENAIEWAGDDSASECGAR
jgi:type 1 glutamine amidotransferase